MRGVGFLSLFKEGYDENQKDEGEKLNLGHEEEQAENSEEQKLKLRKEELDVAKNRVDIGKVEFGKEIIEEQQIVNVPVVHEEVVVERKSINEPSDRPIGEGDDEHFSLSVGEDKVEVGKHTIVTGEVSAHKREVEENREIKETIKHEEARIYKDGEANIVDDNEVH
ncbi:hypothetical protein ASZ90_019866 [hydrocarbon metagenome]|uniref:DUF2382 domain-containing protein n=1 Tax=hydrocarbon metagenome TaxID=938273 RepID=A0A0W8E319_9ZZZZ